jgi:hypothetical protein
VRQTDGLLIAALALGVLIALFGLVESGPSPLDAGTAALVNGTPISTDEYRSLLVRRTREGSPVEELLGTLDDMIDEELLIQRALELGLLRRDSNVRVAVIQAMEKSILSEERGQIVTEEELEDFFARNAALFAEPLMLQLEEIVVAPDVDADAIKAALERGETPGAIAAAHDAVTVIRLPPVPLSLEALRRRYPEELLTRLDAAAEDEVLSYASQRGTHLVKVSGRVEAQVPAFEDVRISVLNELQMQRLDSAYEDYLAWLRQRAEVRRNESLAP